MESTVPWSEGASPVAVGVTRTLGSKAQTSHSTELRPKRVLWKRADITQNGRRDPQARGAGGLLRGSRRTPPGLISCFHWSSGRVMADWPPPPGFQRWGWGARGPPPRLVSPPPPPLEPRALSRQDWLPREGVLLGKRVDQPGSQEQLRPRGFPKAELRGVLPEAAGGLRTPGPRHSRLTGVVGCGKGAPLRLSLLPVKQKLALKDPDISAAIPLGRIRTWVLGSSKGTKRRGRGCRFPRSSCVDGRGCEGLSVLLRMTQ